MSSDATEDYARRPARRKNGMQASCENCRIAKARCDHTGPPCGRCRRQRKACVYHPAPMSRTATPTTVVPKGSRVSTVSLRKLASPSAHDARTNASPRQPARMALGYYSRQPSRMTLGYMGSTGFGAILQENKYASLWDVSEDQAGQDRPASSGEERYGSVFGASILAWLPDMDLYEHVLEWSECHGPHNLTNDLVMRNFAQAWSVYKHLLQEPRNTEALCKLSDILSENTSKTLHMPSDNQDWVTSFSGKNSRWELIGEVFVAIGAAAFAITPNDPLFSAILPENMSKKSFACTMLECADAVVKLVDQLATPCSILQVILLNHCVQLQSMVAGDTSYELWRRNGALAAAVTGLGLHLQANEAESRSALYREMRSQALSGAFCVDKVISTFVGRPPCLSRRFVSADMILDVPNDLLYRQSSIRELEKSVDRNGWNLNGQIYPSTESRALYQMCVIRDEILELSLTTLNLPNIALTIHDLRNRMDDVFRSLPAIYRTSFDKKMIATKTSLEALGVFQVQAMHVQNTFLVERIEHSDRDDQRLLQAAKDLLALTVLFWSERDAFAKFRDHLHWCICCYGIPAGSALAIDLWKQTVSPLTNPTSSQRSAVIQNLSLFVACLEWVGPEDGNYVLCGRVAHMIQNILDRALSPAQDPVMPEPLGFDLTDINLTDMPAFGQDLQDWFDISGWTGAMQY